MKIGTYQMEAKITFMGLTLDEAGRLERYLSEGLWGTSSPIKAENFQIELTQTGEKQSRARSEDKAEKKTDDARKTK